MRRLCSRPLRSVTLTTYMDTLRWCGQIPSPPNPPSARAVIKRHAAWWISSGLLLPQLPTPSCSCRASDRRGPTASRPTTRPRSALPTSPTARAVAKLQALRRIPPVRPHQALLPTRSWPCRASGWLDQTGPAWARARMGQLVLTRHQHVQTALRSTDREASARLRPASQKLARPRHFGLGSVVLLGCIHGCIQL